MFQEIRNIAMGYNAGNDIYANDTVAIGTNAEAYGGGDVAIGLKPAQA